MTVEVNAIKIAIEELVRSAGERLDRSPWANRGLA